jgi:alpha-tubulin suppressor-like RCC1 family protein
MKLFPLLKKNLGDRIRLGLFVTFSALIVLAFQNCGRGFVQQNSGINSQASLDTSKSPSTIQVNMNPKIFSDANRTCIVNQTGKIKCWGEQYFPGDLPFQTSLVPKTFEGLDNVQSLALADSSACALLVDGQVKCWGDNSAYQFGKNLPLKVITPTTIENLSGVTSLVGGSIHYCALLDSKKVKCWGLGIFGQLGDGLGQSSGPVEVSGLSNVTAISAHGLNSCAIIGNGAAVKCWGIDSAGQLGLDHSANEPLPFKSLIPVEISGLVNVKELSVGDGHICSVSSVGNVQCWGSNYNGELGDNTTVNSKIPVDVQETELVEHVYAGFAKTCLVTRQGQTKCWGNKTLGPVGTDVGYLIPTAVEGIITRPATVISMGFFHNCVLQAGPSIKCWGGNFKGQLGNGLTVDSITPIEVTGIFN